MERVWDPVCLAVSHCTLKTTLVPRESRLLPPTGLDFPSAAAGLGLEWAGRQERFTQELHQQGALGSMRVSPEESALSVPAWPLGSQN